MKGSTTFSDGKLTAASKFLGAALLFVLFLFAAPGQAATITVTSGGDSGSNTLRNAIASAAAGDIIQFSVTTVTLTSAELVVDKNLTIDGGANGVTITRSGVAQFRIFNISSGTVSLIKLTISNGNPGTGQAGGVQNNGNLTMTNCAVTGNTSIQGGGIQNDNVLTMSNCTISGNMSTGSGGGLIMYGTSTTLTNCTISGNTTSANGGGFNVSSGTLNLTNCTVANNTAYDGGGMSLSGSTHVFKNTIVANNTATAGGDENINGTVSATSSYNLIGVGGTGGLADGINNNQVGVANVFLDVLASNGGYTQTIAILPGSPAADKGVSVPGMTTDQRGQTRPLDIASIAAASGGNNSDIGAYEAQITCSTVTVSPMSLPNGSVGTSYSQPITASGGTAPYAFTVTSGSLPHGLILSGGGMLAGTPSTTGTYNFTITAAYSFGCTGSQAYTLTINPCGNIKTFTVNDLGDGADASAGDGQCATSGGVCTLRAAIEELNASSGCENNINFSVTGTINLTTVLPNLAVSLTMTGPGADMLTIQRSTAGGTPSFRVFNIPSGTTTSIAGLTISNGNLINDFETGAGILNAGTLTLTNCEISNNRLEFGNDTGLGAGIYNSGGINA